MNKCPLRKTKPAHGDLDLRFHNYNYSIRACKRIIWAGHVNLKVYISIFPCVQWSGGDHHQDSQRGWEEAWRQSFNQAYFQWVDSISTFQIVKLIRICLFVLFCFKPEVVGMRWLHARWNWGEVLLLWKSVRHLRWITCKQYDDKQSREMKARRWWRQSNQNHVNFQASIHELHMETTRNNSAQLFLILLWNIKDDFFKISIINW